ncbi:MAG: ribose ABC transporter permease, partial [bacterium]|nr:ribose ABC transporter permease [bacterium]
MSAPRRWTDAGVLQSQGLLLILAGLMIFFSLKSPFFWATSNLLNVAASSTVLAIMAAPQTFLIVSGGFDVSVGATIAISTVSLGLLLAAGVPMAAAIVAVLFIGLAVGAANATLVVLLRVNPLIATLGTMSIFTGLAHFLSSGQTEVVR